jgi:hypothetical protein
MPQSKKSAPQPLGFEFICQKGSAAKLATEIRKVVRQTMGREDITVRKHVDITLDNGNQLVQINVTPKSIPMKHLDILKAMQKVEGASDLRPRPILKTAPGTRNPLIL